MGRATGPLPLLLAGAATFDAGDFSLTAVFDVHHEAGHVIAAVALGTPVRRATLHGVTTMVRSGCPRAQYNEAVIALAGPEGETRRHGYSASQCAELWGSSVWRDDLANALRHLDGAEIAPALHQARRLVNENWNAIEVLAAALLDRKELNGDEINAVLGREP